jgi:hypothetical protein
MEEHRIPKKPNAGSIWRKKVSGKAERLLRNKELEDSCEK